MRRGLQLLRLCVADAMSPTDSVLHIAPGIMRIYGLAYLLPALFGPKLLWWVMPITEFAVAIYTILWNDYGIIF